MLKTLAVSTMKVTKVKVYMSHVLVIALLDIKFTYCREYFNSLFKSLSKSRLREVSAAHSMPVANESSAPMVIIRVFG